jgi:hypothetical protein
MTGMTPVDPTLRTPRDPYDGVVEELASERPDLDRVIALLGIMPPLEPAAGARLAEHSKAAAWSTLGELAQAQHAIADRTLTVREHPGSVDGAYPVPTPPARDPQLDEDERAVTRLVALVNNRRPYAAEQLVTARTGESPVSPEVRIRQAIVKEAAEGFFAAVEGLVPNCRSRNIALTAIEDALMRANRAFFEPTKR